MTQKQRILDYMRLNGKLCSLAPLDWSPRITRTAAQIHDLEADGHDIISSPCRLHPDTASHVTYQLAEEEGTLF